MKRVRLMRYLLKIFLREALLTNQTECSWRLSLLCAALADMSDTNLANQGKVSYTRKSCVMKVNIRIHRRYQIRSNYELEITSLYAISN